MINLDKIKQEKCQSPLPPPLPPFKKICPSTILPPPFLISRFPSLGEVIKIYSPPFKKSGEGKSELSHQRFLLRKPWKKELNNPLLQAKTYWSILKAFSNNKKFRYTTFLVGNNFITDIKRQKQIFFLSFLESNVRP